MRPRLTTHRRRSFALKYWRAGEGQLSSIGHSANATTQTELDSEGLEESLLQAALGTQDAPVEQYHFESDSEMMIIDENSYWQKDSEGVWREREGQPTV